MFRQVVQMYRSVGSGPHRHVDSQDMDAYFRAAEAFVDAAVAPGGALAGGAYAVRVTTQQGMLHEARDSTVADLEHSDMATVPAALLLVVAVVGAPALVVLLTPVSLTRRYTRRRAHDTCFICFATFLLTI